MGYKPSGFEQAKFDYSPLGKIFDDGLKKQDKKEGLLKRIKNIGVKNEELLKAFSAANKISNAAKNESDKNYDSKFAFYRFYRDFKNFKRISIGSKYDEIDDFYTLLNAFIKTRKTTTTQTKNRKKEVMKKVVELYNDYFDLCRKNYIRKT